MEGDTVEIRQGDLLLNGKSVDDTIPLAHNYLMHRSELAKVIAVEKVAEYSVIDLSVDSVIVNLSDKTVTNLSIKAKRWILPKLEEDKEIAKQFSAPWNQDNFGPVVVPKGKMFVLGDNRQNSQDSRCIGFIDKADYVATVIGR